MNFETIKTDFKTKKKYRSGVFQKGVHVSVYLYGFNGMERDDEVKGKGNSYDYGARMYDSRVVRWFSTDKIVQPLESPYSSHGNNPIAFVDKDGNDNIIYLVLLPSAEAKLSKTDIENVALELRYRYKQLGVSIDIVVASSPAEFNPKYIDGTDSYVLIGNPEELARRQTSWDVTSYEPGDGSNVLELSESANYIKSSYGKKMFTGHSGNLITVNLKGVDDWSKNLKILYTSTIAWAIIHGTGHNAGYDADHGAQYHNKDADRNLMSDGSIILGSVNPSMIPKNGSLLDSEYKPLSMSSYDFSLKNNFYKIYEQHRNTQVSFLLRNRKFTSTVPRDNYNENKRKSEGSGSGGKSRPGGPGAPE